MSSRRGRLNWSNLEVHISDKDISEQHCFSGSSSFPSVSTLGENVFEEEREVNTASALPTSKKRSWMPKAGVGDVEADYFVGNFMLTNAEQTAIEKKYTKSTKIIESSKTSPVTRPIQLPTRLPSIRETPIPIRTTNLSIGQHLLHVFVCHVESFSCVYIMFGDDYNRAMKLFQEMNTCNELTQPSTNVFEPKENDLVALYRDTKWFRGRCLTSTDTHVNVLCIDSGVVIDCARTDLRRLPESKVAISSLPEDIHAECFDLLYKDRYEAIVTKLQSSNRPTIVLYHGNENINDQLLAIVKSI